MLTRNEIEHYLRELNDELALIDVKGEICLYGGAVMCLAYDARPSTKDVDAVFKPATIIRELAGTVSKRHGLDKDWLNDGVKGFVVSHDHEVIFQWSHLDVLSPDGTYLLAMKTLSARADTSDKRDVQFLIKELDIEDASAVFEILEKYYPQERIKPATQFFIEELFQ